MYPTPMFWHSGQFLDPQHFQETDRHNQAARAEMLKFCRPHCEGVVSLEISAEALAQNTLVLDRAELVFPDASHVLWTGNIEEGNASNISRSLETWNFAENPVLTVYACLNRLREQYNVAGINREEAAVPEHDERYDAVVDARETPDRYAQRHATLAGEGCRLSRLYYNVRLAWENELDAGGGGMRVPIARLRAREGGVEADPDFIPPLVAIHAHAGLDARLKVFLSRVAEIPRRFVAGAGGGLPHLPELFTRQAAARLHAELSQILAWRFASPWDVYRALRTGHADIASAAVMVEGFQPPGVPAYDHHDLAHTLVPLIDICEALLSRYLPDVVARLEPTYENGLLLFRLPETALLPGIGVALAVRSEEPVRTVLREGRLIGGAPGAVRDAVRLALPELPLAPIDVPRGLPSQSGIAYLAPNLRHPAWKNVLADRTLALAYYPEPDPGAARLAAAANLYLLRGGVW